MSAKTVLIAAGSVIALGFAPAFAGDNCHSLGHAGSYDTIASADQSTPADTQTQTSIPFPLPTINDTAETVTAQIESTTTATE